MTDRAADPLRRSNLTRSQLRLWAGQQLQPSVPLYNMAFAFRLAGAIDAERFRAAFARLVREHDALRTLFDEVDGVPRQRVVDVLDVESAGPLDVIDLGGGRISEAEGLERAMRSAQARCERPFDLGRRTFDSALYRVGPESSVWYFGQHHLVSDAWSVGLLFERMAALYDSVEAGSSTAPRFADAVEIECRRRAEADSRTGASTPRLRARSMPSLRLYGRATAGLSTASERLTLALGRRRSDRLRELATRPEVRALTPDLGIFNLLATLLLAFLHRVGDQASPTIGAPLHNRPTPDLRRTVGLLTEVFPLSLEVAREDTFLSLLQRVSVATTELLRRGADPLLAEAPAPGDAPQERGRVGAVLNYIPVVFGELGGRRVAAEWLHPRHHDREHPLRLQVHDFAGSGELTFQLDLNRDLFDGELRGRTAGHLLRLTDALLEDWGRPVAAVDLLTAEERRRLVEDLNRIGDSERLECAQSTVLEMLAEVAARSPDVPAVVCGEDSLDYARFGELKSLWAARLARLTASEPAVIGLAMGRSIEAVVGLFAVLEAGCAYLPIDPAWPAERIRLMLDDADVTLVLTDRDARLPALGDGLQVVELALESGSPAAPRGERSTASAPPGASLDATAYVIYTSGSTGRPKGVAVGHRALANYLSWARSYYGGAAGDLADRPVPLSMPLFTPLSFDLTVTSIFLPLLSGGSVVVYPPTARRIDLALLDVVGDSRVDLIKLTPSHLRLLADGGAVEGRVRQLIFGGEALSVQTARRARELFGGETVIHNEYGPTEATVGCVVHRFEPDGHPVEGFAGDTERSGEAMVPIGRPIDNLRAYVLDDRHLLPVPEGVTGSLYLGGRGLAEGYLKDAERTAERFIESPLDPDRRIYRSGDLARVDRRGRLVYLGRDDDQVKIRGARIELGEIEAALAA